MPLPFPCFPTMHTQVLTHGWDGELNTPLGASTNKTIKTRPKRQQKQRAVSAAGPNDRLARSFGPKDYSGCPRGQDCYPRTGSQLLSGRRAPRSDQSPSSAAPLREDISWLLLRPSPSCAVWFQIVSYIRPLVRYEHSAAQPPTCLWPCLLAYLLACLLPVVSMYVRIERGRTRMILLCKAQGQARRLLLRRLPTGPSIVDRPVNVPTRPATLG